MAATHRTQTLAATHDARILTLLRARIGGTTTAEMCDILDMPRHIVWKRLLSLQRSGHVTMHGLKSLVHPRYTLADDPLTRPLEPLRPDRWKEYTRRRSVILRSLETGPMLRHSLAVRAGVTPATKLHRTLQIMMRAGEVRKVGEGMRVRWALAR